MIAVKLYIELKKTTDVTSPTNIEDLEEITVEITSDETTKFINNSASNQNLAPLSNLFVYFTISFFAIVRLSKQVKLKKLEIKKKILKIVSLIIKKKERLRPHDKDSR